MQKTLPNSNKSKISTIITLVMFAAVVCLLIYVNKPTDEQAMIDRISASDLQVFTAVCQTGVATYMADTAWTVDAKQGLCKHFDSLNQEAE